MPRAARIKHPHAIYHVMSHSITEFDLFPDDSDKEYFLNLLQKCKEKFDCKVYAFCLMTNHYHAIIDTCGYDISKYMKSLNQTYVKYINKKYSRKGHLLTERFNSKIIDSDEYLLTVSAYIHNNCKDLKDYKGREFEYPYSSMGIYIGKHKDLRKLIDKNFILQSVNESDQNKALKAYCEMVIEKRELGINKKLRQYFEEFEKEQYTYVSHREILLRDKKPEEVIKCIAGIFSIDDEDTLIHKWKRKTMQFREVTAYALNNLCGLEINEVKRLMYNISHSCCANLINKGYEVLKNNPNIKKSIFAGI